MTFTEAARQSQVPDRIKVLPFDESRGVHVPWFVVWLDGKPEFRVADAAKREKARRNRLCWVCGQPLARFRTFVIGPMCVLNRISGDPPSHRDCAEYSARVCPFLVNANMRRREGGLPEGVSTHGIMIKRNPGVCVTWTVEGRGYTIEGDGMGGWIYRIADPHSFDWWCRGRKATREEALAAIEAGCPILEDVEKHHPDALREIAELKQHVLESYLPKAIA